MWGNILPERLLKHQQQTVETPACAILDYDRYNFENTCSVQHYGQREHRSGRHQQTGRAAKTGPHANCNYCDLIRLAHTHGTAHTASARMPSQANTPRPSNLDQTRRSLKTLCLARRSSNPSPPHRLRPNFLTKNIPPMNPPSPTHALPLPKNTRD